MRIVVDLSSATPQYEQIRAQVVAHIASGMLERGERLPTIRNLAADLGIAAGTVARAYRELESAGHVSTRRKIGTVVTAQGRTSGRTHDVARTLVEVARSEGVSSPDLIDILRSALLAASLPDMPHTHAASGAEPSDNATRRP